MREKVGGSSRGSKRGWEGLGRGTRGGRGKGRKWEGDWRIRGKLRNNA